METKVCSKCKIEKETINFHKAKDRKDGLYPQCIKCKNGYISNREKTDELYKLRRGILRSIRKALLYMKHEFRNDSKLKDILGCSFKDFKIHLESQFEPWMTWDNRGLYNGLPNYGWDIDHIIPKASAKTKEDIIKLNHYTNLRPRCSYLNRVIDVRKIK